MQATRGPLLEGLQQRMGGGEKRRACMRPLLEGPWQLSLYHTPTACSFVGFIEEEAVHTYTEIVEALARGGALEEGRGGLEGGEGR